MGHNEIHPLSQLNWELSVLSRAIAYQNLSEAATHIGISQPQLSRIVSKLETELKAVILDRGAKRKSGWTPMALKICEAFMKSERRLEREIFELIEGAEVSALKVGTLEGFSSLAIQLCENLLVQGGMKHLELDVFDLDELEKLFLKGELDLIFTYREPSKRKYRYERELGFQHIEWVQTNSKVMVMSSFEYHAKMHKKEAAATERTLVSNSLEIRKEWFKRFGGTGTMPSEVLGKVPSKEGNDERVYLIGSDQIMPGIWDKVDGFKFKLS